MSDYAICELCEADLAATAEVWFRAWHAAFPGLSHPMPFEAWLPRLRHEVAINCVCRIVTYQGSAVGFVAVDTAKACLEQIFVAPEHQGVGVSKLLLTEAKRLSPNGFTLTTLQRNERAAAFYRRAGLKAGHTGINPVNGLPNIEYIWRPGGSP